MRWCLLGAHGGATLKGHCDTLAVSPFLSLFVSRRKWFAPPQVSAMMCHPGQQLKAMGLLDLGPEPPELAAKTNLSSYKVFRYQCQERWLIQSATLTEISQVNNPLPKKKLILPFSTSEQRQRAWCLNSVSLTLRNMESTAQYNVVMYILGCWLFLWFWKVHSCHRIVYYFII